MAEEKVVKKYKVSTDPERRNIKGDELRRRKAIERHSMPQQGPDRVNNWDEVPYGFSAEQAMKEAERCWDCRVPYCIDGCPVGIDIPAFLRLTEKGDFIGAIRKIKEANALPAICGRVCPKSEQCELKCVVSKKNKPVAIGFLEAFLADYERKHNAIEIPGKLPSTGKKVAVVGAGPAGITVAGELAQRGHEVSLFEALSKPGGVLRYGIPDFRLPKEIVNTELKVLDQLGVKVQCNTVIGKTITVEELDEEGFDAIFIGTGAGLPWFLGIEGENLNGVFSANEYLTRVILMNANRFPEFDTPVFVGKKTVVIGAGNTAMDACRTAKRLGSDEVTIVYRRSIKEAPCLPEELDHAQEEGIKFKFLTSPLRFLGDENGWLKALECQEMKLGEPDDSGRRRPVPVEGSIFNVECDVAIISIGFSPNPIVPQTTEGMETNRRGCIVVDENGKTTRAKVYAGGDIVNGGSTVIMAMGEGKRAAATIHDYLRSLK